MSGAAAVNEWVRPSTRPDVIEELVSGVDRYNPSNVNILEDYLYHQIRTDEYDCLANLAILKLYQFNPDLYNGDVVVNILIKALTSSPMPDFNLCVALLSEQRHFAIATPSQDEVDPLPQLLPQLITLSTLLEQCRFPDFWRLYHSEEYDVLRDNYTVECKGFEQSVREVVSRAVRTTFLTVGETRLSAYLNLQGQDHHEFIRERGWTLKDNLISIPPNPDNQIEATVVQESIQLPQLTKIVAHAA